MKKLGFAIACVFLLLLTPPGIASAQGYQWKTPIPTPNEYGSRVYGYEQMTRFWINEHGYGLGTNNADLISKMWSSVFYIPNGPQDTGYTAVTSLDQHSNTIDDNNTAYQTVLQNFLEAFNIPQDSPSDCPGQSSYTYDWLVSPQYNTATYGRGSPFSQKSGLDFDVPLHFWVNPPSGTETLSGVLLKPPSNPSYTIGGSGAQTPYPLYVGSAADVGAGYQPDGSVAYWEAYGGPDEWGNMSNGIANMTRQEAVIQYDTYSGGYGQSGVQQDRSTTGNVIVSYPFGTEVEALNLSNEKAIATVINSTPYDVIGEDWYAYVEKPDREGEFESPQLLTQGHVTIGAQPLGNTMPNQSQVTFNVPSSDAGDELIVTLNETVNSNGSVNPEGLPVYYAWGPNSNTEVPADRSPKDEIAATDVYYTTSQGTDYDPSGTPAAYSDNAQYLVLPGSSSGGNGPSLVVTPPTANVVVGGRQKYTATYYSGRSGDKGTDVSSSATWYSGNSNIATVVVTGGSGGLATGVAAGTTGVTAYYTPPGGSQLKGCAQINVSKGVVTSGYDIAVTSLDIGDGGGVKAGGTYTANVTFNSNFPNGGDVEINWYQRNKTSSSTGEWSLIDTQTKWIDGNSTNAASVSWTYPLTSPATTSVTILVTVDDPLTGLPSTSLHFQPLPFPYDTGNGQMESDVINGYDPNNWKEAGASLPASSSTIYESTGWTIIPIQTTQTVTTKVPYTYYTYSWKQVPIIPGPKYNMGPPRYYLSY